MKIRNLYSTIFLLLLAFNVIGGSAYSFTTPTPDLDPQKHDYLQKEQNTSALYLEEVSIHVPGQANSKNDLAPGSYFISGKSIFNYSFLNNNKLTSNIIRDKKEILKTYIFPFHFFW